MVNLGASLGRPWLLAPIRREATVAEAGTTPGQALLARTGYAVRASLNRSDARAIIAITTVGYLLGYLWGIGHLAPGAGGFGVTVVPDAASRFFQPSLSAYSFEPIAIVSAGQLTYLFALNTVLGFGLAALVGLNLGVSYLAWRQPKACGIGSRSAGALAGIPALVSGSVCCGPPILLLAVGAQASGLLLTAFEFLLPVAAVLLVGSLFLVGRQVQLDAVRDSADSG